MKEIIWVSLLSAVLVFGSTIGGVLLTLNSMEYTTSTKGRNPDGSINWVINLYIGPFSHTIKVSDDVKYYGEGLYR